MKSIAMSDAKAHLSDLIREVEDYETYYLTKNGKVAAVLVNPDEWEGLRETLEILSDEDLMEQIRASRSSRKTYTMKHVFKNLLK